MSAVAAGRDLGRDGGPVREGRLALPGARPARLAVEPSTAYDDVERLLAAQTGLEARLGRAPLRDAADDQDGRGDRRRCDARSRWRFPASRRPSSASRPGASKPRSRTLFGGENVVQFGPSSALPARRLGRARSREGEAVLIDAWDKPEGYYYDITRSTFFGKPTDEYRKIWSIVLEAQSAAIEKAAPGRALLRGGRRGAARHREGGLRRVLHAPSRPRPRHRRARAALHGRPRPDACSSPA